MASMSGLDRYELYVTMLANRDQALLVLAGLVLSGLLWWSLLGRWPQLRRWLAWGAVAVCCVVMLVLVLSGGSYV